MSSVPPARRAAIPRGIWALGLVSLCMDLSSEMIHGLLPVFMVSVLGAGAISVGVVEGVAEATAAITRVFSGALSDLLGRRKPLVLAGYGLAALSKPLFPLAASVGEVFAARFMDRIGKGIRGAPRDALIADLAPPEARGASYGLRQALDTAGAFGGPLAAVGLMLLLGGDFRAVFWIAAAPAAAAVAVLALAVREPRAAPAAGARRAAPIRAADLRRLGGPFWALVAVGGLFTLARFSEAFLVLRAQAGGLADALVPVVLVVMNAAYMLSAYPAGRLSDRLPRTRLLAWGLAVLLGADLVLAFAPGLAAVLAGVALWGLHMGLTQGLLSALVADCAPARLRGSAFGVFHLVTGVALLLASLLAGVLWQRWGPAATFLGGAALAAATLPALRALPRGVRAR